jgi:hypothetical protein
MDNEKLVLFDCLTDSYITLNKIGISKQCKNLGFDYTSVYKLLDNKSIAIKNRYILANKKDLIFILVDIDSKKEYKCINNATIFSHLNCKYDNNEAKYIYELKSGRQRFASICNKVFYLKGAKLTLNRLRYLKNESSRLFEIINRRDLKKDIRNHHQQKLIRLVKSKSCSKITEKLIGCKSKDFIKYMEFRFVEGMSWDNYGEWHIDHIIPCSKFNLYNQDELNKCFNYKNLQPLWATINIAKKYTKLLYFIGNIEKNNRRDDIDYKTINMITELFTNNFKDPYKGAFLLSSFLTKNGYRFLTEEECLKVDNDDK